MSKRMRQMYDRGATVAQVADKFGVSYSVARYRLRLAGTEFRRGRSTVGVKHYAGSLDDYKKEIQRARKKGMSVVAMAKNWGVSRARIYQVIGGIR